MNLHTAIFSYSALQKVAAVLRCARTCWKTLRIWSSHLNDGLISIPPTTLTLITTAEAPDGSVASNLRPGRQRNSTAAHQRLVEIARTSTNDELKQAFFAFQSLSEEQRLLIVDAIQILDRSPDISDVSEKNSGQNSRGGGSTAPKRSVRTA